MGVVAEVLGLAVTLTPIQLATWHALTLTPAQPSDIAARCGLERAQVSGALFRLSAKGLAIHTAGGWKIEPQHHAPVVTFDTKLRPGRGAR